jgi:hypothetical protein
MMLNLKERRQRKEEAAPLHSRLSRSHKKPSKPLELVAKALPERIALP